jgi:hypothetical protein
MADQLASGHLPYADAIRDYLKPHRRETPQ